MKKFLMLISALALALTLAACKPPVDPEEIVLSFGGLQDFEVTEEDAVNVLDGITATGSDEVDYSSVITVNSDDCTITDNVLDTNTPGTCTVTYSAVSPDGKLARETITITIKQKPLPPVPEYLVAEWNWEDDSDLEGWAIYTAGGGDIVASVEDGALKMVTKSGGQRYETRYDFMGVPLEQGYPYKVTFKMKSDIDGKKVHLNFGELLPSDPWFTPFKPEGLDVITLSTEWQTFEYSFMMELDNQDGGPLFEMGNMEGSEGLDATIWVDDLKITGGSGEDTVDPTITGADNVVIFIEDSVVFDPYAGVTATDYPDVDLTDSIILSGDTVDTATAGTYMLYYVVYDGSLNSVRVVRTVTVKNDTEAPMLEGTEDVVVFVGQGFELDAGVKAMDNRDGDITDNIVIDGGGYDADTEGVYTVKYTIEDAVGNKTEVERRVEVSALEFNATDLVDNGSFDMGPWKSYHANWDGATADSKVYVMNEELVFDVVNLGGDFWHNLVEQPGIDLVNGKSYRLSFDAKASVASALETELLERTVFNITTDWDTYTLDITASADEEKVLKFLIGTVTGAVPATFTFDNIKFEEFDGTAVVADTDQIINGDFTGEFYTDGWNAHGGTLKVNDYSAIFNYGSAGDNPWDNKLEFGGVELEPGRIYMLKFSAMGDAARDFRTNCWGGNMDHTSAPLQLTTEWKDFLVIFKYEANGPCGLEFNLGKVTDNSAGSMFYVDNVVIEQAELPSDFFLLEQDLFENPKFEVGAWKSYYQWGEGDSTVQVMNEELVAEIHAIGNADWHNLVEQPGMQLVNGKTYRVTFDAKADAATRLDVELLGRSPQAITTSWATYTHDFSATADGEHVLKFLFGKFDDSVATKLYFDNIKLEEWDGSAIVADTDQIENGDFAGEFFTDGWSLVTGSGSEMFKINDYVAQVMYDGSPVGADSVYVETSAMTLVEGNTYVITFDANVSADRDVVVQLTDGTYVVSETVSMTTGWKKYEVEFTYANAADAKFQILLGDGVVDSKLELDNFAIGGYVLIDEQNFVETDIAAADFEGGNWTTYKHYWDGSTIEAWFSQSATNEFVVDVVNVSTADWHALLEQGGYNLVVGKTYRVTFDAKASVARDIEVELDGTRFGGVDLTTEMATYTVDFVWGGTEDKEGAMLKFMFGKVSEASVPAVITLDNVMVEEFDGTAVVADTNQTVNGTFDEFYTDGYMTAGAKLDIEWGEAVVKYDAAGANPWDTSIFIEGLTWEPGETYLIEFKLKADEVRDIEVFLWDGANGQSVVVDEVGTTFNSYRVVFTYGIGANSKIEIRLGQVTENYAGTMLYVDDIVVSKLTEETPAS